MGEMMMDVRIFASLKAQIDIQRNDLTTVSSLWIFAIPVMGYRLHNGPVELK
jgi:hypothetical protein